MGWLPELGILLLLVMRSWLNLMVPLLLQLRKSEDIEVMLMFVGGARCYLAYIRLRAEMLLDLSIIARCALLALSAMSPIRVLGTELLFRRNRMKLLPGV